MINLPKMPSMSLEGKTAMITGASSGIGQGAAAALAGAGASVICVARGKDRLVETEKALKEKGWKVKSQVMDVNHHSEIQNIFKKHKIDIVVNAAGQARHSPAIETKLEDYDAVMNVNLRSAYFISAIAAKSMLDRDICGSIIHISSQMAHVGGIDRAVYSASKHAIEGMVKSMAIEWGPNGIRINSICPTFVRTPLTESTFQNPDRVNWIKSKIKLGRVAEVSDIMGAVLYLATDLSSMVTGTSILVDGGWTAE
jgi:2-deoxy-D-gluconate 3-dehydrogenase